MATDGGSRFFGPLSASLSFVFADRLALIAGVANDSFFWSPLVSLAAARANRPAPFPREQARPLRKDLTEITT